MKESSSQTETVAHNVAVGYLYCCSPKRQNKSKFLWIMYLRRHFCVKWIFFPCGFGGLTQIKGYEYFL